MRKLTTLIILLSVFIMTPSIANAITVSISDVAQNENNGNMTFTVTITDDTVTGNAKFNYATVDGTATTGDNDYTSATGTVTFNNGDPVGATRTFDVPITGDTKVEDDETFTVTLTPQGTDTVADSPATGTINNDDAATLAIDDVTHNEGNAGGTTYTFTVTLTGDVDQAFTVAYATADDSATAPDNAYTAVAATALNFAGTNGETQTFNITVNGDTKVEADERFFVNLSNVLAGGKDVTISDAQGDGNITNDDTATLEIDNVTNNEGNAGGTTYSFTVTLTGAVDQAFTVDYATADDSATAADNDYNAVAATALNFAGTNGETQTFNITVNGDTKVEADEKFFVNLSNVQAGGKNVTINDPQGNGNITNDDAATLTIAGVTLNEGSGGGTTDFDFTVTLDNDVQDGFTVAYTTDDGTATVADGDYTDNDSSLNFAGTAGESHTITVAVTADGVVEADEAFTVALGTVTPVSADAGDITKVGSPATGTITNDDRYQITIDDPTVNEGVGNATFTVSISPALQAGDTVTVDYATSNGSAVAPGDYTTTNGTLTINTPGATTGTFTVPIINDTTVENAENFVVDLSTSTPAATTNISDSQGTCTINDNDEYVFSIADATAVTEGTPASFRISVTPVVATGHVVTVDYSTTPGTATGGGTDYTNAVSVPATVSPGATFVDVTVATNDDALVEDQEQFTVTLDPGSASSSVGSASISSVVGDDTSTGTINDNDTATVGLTLASDGAEPATSATFTVTMTKTNNTGSPITVSYIFTDGTATGGAGVAGDDYDNTTTSVPIPNGSATATITVPVFDDALVEATEAFQVTLTSTDNGQVTVSGGGPISADITSDDAATLAIDDVTHNEGNAGGTTYTFTVTLTGAVDQAFTVDYTTADDSATAADNDYNAVAATALNFAGTNGETQTFNITVNGDTKVEADERFFVNLSNVQAGGKNVTISDAQGDGNITNEDLYSIDASAGPNGAIDPSGVSSVTCGSQPTYYMTPYEGYHVSHVMVNGASVGGVGVYTFDPVVNDQSIYAVFDWGESNKSCVEVNQQQNAGQWNLLGTYNFVKGKGAFVTITRVDGDENSTCADAVKFVRTSDGTEIIVDNADADYTETGNWTDSSAQNSYPSGVASRYSDDGGAIAAWTPDLPSSDTYDVYAWWTTAGTRAQHAPYCVYGLSGKIVTATAGIHGYIISSGTTVGPDASHAFTFDSGSNAVFTISAETGYVIQEVLVDDLSAVNDCVPPATGATATTYTFTNISASHSIEATFEDHSDTCTNATPVTCDGVYDGKISPEDDWDYFKLETGGGVYTIWTEGEDDTYGYLLDTSCVTDSPIAEDDNSGPNERFEIADVELAAGTYYIAVRQDNDGSLNPDLDYTLHLSCQHIIRASAQSGGDIVPGGDNIVNHGANIIFTITADPGNSIADVLVDGQSMGGVTTYTFTNVTANHTIIAQFTMPPGLCNDISDQPLDTIQTGAPANIVFVIDDSGSMDWEIMTSENDGKFENYEYIFDDPGDHVYKTGTNSQILEEDEEDRKLWKSQWYIINKMYYNPKMYYIPWPTLTDADPDNPRSHPIQSTPTFDINATFDTVGQAYIVENEGTFDENDIFLPSGGTRFVVTGTWRRSSVDYWHGPDPARSIYSNDLGATATWTTALPAAGDYEVLAWWTATDGRARHVNYTIHAAGGDEIKANQSHQNNGGQWNSLGTYTFGTTGSVTVTREDDQDHTCADAIAFVPTVGATTINIKRAHYYTWADLDGDNALDSGETVYFVNLDSGTSTIQYYVLDVSDDMIEAGDLTPIAEADVAVEARPKNQDGSFRTYAEDKQNFANWFSFYRRRELAATNAIANVIVQMQGVNIGYRSINGYLIQPVLPVHVGTEDETNALLNKLYTFGIIVHQASTPLRAGLRETGKYFDKDDGDDGGVGDSPIASAEDGGECQQNFAIMFTDGHYNGGAPGFANIDGDHGVPYEDDQPNTLADVAMYYYENDLADLLENDVPPNPADDATHQHMVTYAVSFGVTGSMDPDDYDLENGPYPEWPNPALNDTYKIDDMWHSAINGRGLFLNASNPMELIDALVKIMENIVARTGSASSVSINGEELYGTLGENIRMFQANYSSGTKTGDIKSYTINAVTGGVSEVPLWSAATMLDDFIDLHGHTNRVIATYSGVSNAGIPFRYANLLASGTTQQLEYLRPDFGDPVIATTENLINYLRGDDTNEQENDGPFRDRESKMGDIVHSSPLYFNGVLYAGGNDGMLHAVSAEDGHEIFAYVPGLVYENLKEFANPRYHHYYFVDLTPFAADMDGESLLIGGLGKGGRGYYCLDISGVSSVTTLTETELANVVKWEYPTSGTTTADIDDMGYSFSKAILIKSNDPDVNSDGERWIVIFGNGYNSENSHAVLFIVDPTDGTLIKKIDTGAGNCNGLSTPLLIDTDSDEKVDYVYAGDIKGNMWKFDLTSADYNNWDVAYYESSGVTPQPVFQAKGPAGLPQPITTKPDAMFHCEREGFLVLFGTGKYMGMIDLMDTSTQTIYGIWDYGDDDDDTEYLGSFNRVSAQKLSNQPLYDVTLLEQTTSFEGYVDIDANGLDEDDPYLRVLSNEPAYWDVTLEDSGTTPCACGDCPTGDECDPNSVGAYPDPVYHAGWYYDLPLSGEKLVSDPMIRLGNAVLVPFVPSDSPCTVGGDTIVMEMDACSGARLCRPQFDINGDGVIDDNDLISIPDPDNPGQTIMVAPTGKRYEGRLQPPVILRLHRADKEIKYFSSSGGKIETMTEKAAPLGLIYWREFD